MHARAVTSVTTEVTAFVQSATQTVHHVEAADTNASLFAVSQLAEARDDLVDVLMSAEARISAAVRNGSGGTNALSALTELYGTAAQLYTVDLIPLIWIDEPTESNRLAAIDALVAARDNATNLGGLLNAALAEAGTNGLPPTLLLKTSGREGAAVDSRPRVLANVRNVGDSASGPGTIMLEKDPHDGEGREQVPLPSLQPGEQYRHLFLIPIPDTTAAVVSVSVTVDAEGAVGDVDNLEIEVVR